MEKSMEIVGHAALCIVAIMYIFALIYLVNDIILILIPRIKCRHVKDCLKDDCPYRIACTHTKCTEWEKIPPWYREPREQQKKPPIPVRISRWFEDFLSDV